MILVAATCTPPPTWTRLFATLALSAAIVATAITAFAAPAHLAKGVHLVGFTEQVTSIPNVQPGDIGARWEVGTDEETVRS